MKKSPNKKNRILNVIRIITLLIILVSINSYAQGNIIVDAVPHDISYYRESRIVKPLVKAIYGRPTHTEKTEVFGNKVPFNQIWRTGANEATEIRFYDQVVFGDTIVEAGTYVLYTIPGENEWELILSSNIDVLGTFQYDPMFDVAKTTINVSKAEKLETFTISFKKRATNQIMMMLGWGSTRVQVPLTFKAKEEYASINKIKAIKNSSKSFN